MKTKVTIRNNTEIETIVIYWDKVKNVLLWGKKYWNTIMENWETHITVHKLSSLSVKENVVFGIAKKENHEVTKTLVYKECLIHNKLKHEN